MELNLTNLNAKMVCLFFLELDMLLSMPCNLHFMPPECQNDNFYCESALKDPAGIHLVHGTGQRFMKDKIFHPIYKFYKEVQLVIKHYILNKI